MNQKIIDLLLELSQYSNDVELIKQFKIDNTQKFEKIRKTEESIVRYLKKLILKQENKI